MKSFVSSHFFLEKMSTKPKITEFSSICRTCMSTKSLMPIFDGKASVNYYSSLIFMVSGVKVEKEDGLPQKICSTCMKFINNAIRFRRQSQSVETTLLKAKNRQALQKHTSNTNLIKNGPADDLSDDETLIIYVNKHKQYKSQEKSNKIENIININENGFIKTELEINITEIELTKDINTEKPDIKSELAYDFKNNVHNDIEFKQIRIENRSQNGVISIKEEINNENNDRRSYNHNDTGTKYNNTGYNHNGKGTEHINTAYNCNNDTETKHNDSGFHDHDIEYNSDESGTKHNEARNNYNDRETCHNNSGYNHNDIGTNMNDSVYDHNESETTHNESRNNHNATETCNNDSGYNHNDTGPNYNNKTHNHNITKTTHNENKTKPITITEMPKNKKNNRVTCKICYKDLSFRSLDVHMTKCHPDLDERKAKCELCAALVTKNRMKRHLSIHGDDFVCVYCKKEQTDIEALKIHAESCVQRVKKRSDNNSAKELKECDICKKIMQKGSLRLHKRLKHAGLGPVCEHCGKRLSNKFRLSEHLRAKHGYEKHKCSLCDFQTAFRVHLKNHERRHRGEKPYVCETCGSKYHSQNQLIQHRYTHNINKDYKCDQCPSSFKTSVHLSVHKNTTHSTTPMCCTVCTRYFRCRHYLLKHMRNVHRITGPVALANETN